MADDRRTGLSDRSLFALALLNFFLADARDGLGPFLDAFLATRGWSSLALGTIATVGGLLGLAVTPFVGALVDSSRAKRALIAAPVILVTAAALVTLAAPTPAIVWGGQIVTALAGAAVAPALTGLTLGLVGQQAFSRQVSRNEFWNHSGNLASLAAIWLAVTALGQGAVGWLMVATACGAIAAVALIDGRRIDHRVARGLENDAGEPGPSGYAVLVRSRGLLLVAVILLIFHFGNAPMSRLVAQQFSVELGTPFRTTALITGVAQAAMIAVAAAAPALIRRFGLSTVFLIALCALPVRGLIAGTLDGFWTVYPVQLLDGIGAGLLGIVTPVAVERLLAGTGRFNVGFAAVMTVQGVGAALSNVVAGWLVAQGGYGLSHLFGAGIALVALTLYALRGHTIFPDRPPAESGAVRP